MTISRRAFLSNAINGMSGLALTGSRFGDYALDGGSASVTLHIRNARLEVAPGQVIDTTIYNDGPGGPPIRLKEGVPTRIEVINDTDSEEYVHWHGLVVSASIDGTREEKSLAVPAHGRIEYVLKPNQAGTRYVHSHAMPMDDLLRGVYSGQFLPVYVEPKSSSGAYDQEIFLITHEWDAYLATEEEEESADESALHRAMGERRRQKEGAMREVYYHVASINGKALGHAEPIRVKTGERLLLRFINASATQNISLALPGHRFQVIALDGNPVPSPAMVDVLEIGVAERVDAVVVMNSPGVWILGSTDPAIRNKGLGVVVEYANRSGSPIWTIPPESNWGYLLFGGKQVSSKPDEEIAMVIDRAHPDKFGMEQWSINGEVYQDGEPPHHLHQGRRYRLVFKNQTEEAHPLHLHRSRFQLAHVNGIPTGGILKDVVVLKGYQTMAIDFLADQPGLSLFHCHQQQHMDAGFKWLFSIA
jgi:FtsP/CotA-like multicopper oxidase with cupredoxin domain